MKMEIKTELAWHGNNGRLHKRIPRVYCGRCRKRVSVGVCRNWGRHGIDCEYYVEWGFDGVVCRWKESRLEVSGKGGGSGVVAPKR